MDESSLTSSPTFIGFKTPTVSDSLILSAPFLFGPQGVGVLYVRKNVRIRPLIEGGTQERVLRAG